MTKSRNRIMCGDFDALREVVGEKITCGDFKVLRKITALTGITGKWTKTKNHCAYRTETGAVLNYWKSTGTILFQGRELPAAELKTAFLRRAVIIQKH